MNESRIELCSACTESFLTPYLLPRRRRRRPAQWDQCGEMLTTAGMGGMDEMGQFYDHCLEALYPPGSCAFLPHTIASLLCLLNSPLSPVSLRGVAAARSHQVAICATTTPLHVTWQKCRNLAVTRAGSIALKVSACGSQQAEQDASALDHGRQVRLTLLLLRPCTQAKISRKRAQ